MWAHNWFQRGSSETRMKAYLSSLGLLTFSPFNLHWWKYEITVSANRHQLNFASEDIDPKEINFEGVSILIFDTCYRRIIFGGNQTKLVTVLLPEAYLEGLDELVRANMYPSRSSVIRSSVRDLLKKELWEKRGR